MQGLWQYHPRLHYLDALVTQEAPAATAAQGRGADRRNVKVSRGGLAKKNRAAQTAALDSQPAEGELSHNPGAGVSAPQEDQAAALANENEPATCMAEALANEIDTLNQTASALASETKSLTHMARLSDRGAVASGGLRTHAEAAQSEDVATREAETSQVLPSDLMGRWLSQSHRATANSPSQSHAALHSTQRPRQPADEVTQHTEPSLPGQSPSARNGLVNSLGSQSDMHRGQGSAGAQTVDSDRFVDGSSQSWVRSHGQRNAPSQREIQRNRLERRLNVYRFGDAVNPDELAAGSDAHGSTYQPEASASRNEHCQPCTYGQLNQYGAESARNEPEVAAGYQWHSRSPARNQRQGSLGRVRMLSIAFTQVRCVCVLFDHACCLQAASVKVELTSKATLHL